MSREWENVSKGMEMVLSGAMFPLIRNAGHKRSESQTSQKVIFIIKMTPIYRAVTICQAQAGS